MARGATKSSAQTTCGACGAGVPYGPRPTTADDGWSGQYAPAEAQVMRQLALAAGVPDACILLEDQATSTFQSALRCTAILRQHGWSTALVTDRYHLRRALFVFRSCGIQAMGSPPQGRLYSRKRWKRWYYRGREACALVWYGCLVLGVKIRRLFSAQP